MQQDETLSQTEPLFIHDCWYFPRGKHIMFAARAGEVAVYPGKYTIRDKNTLQEVRNVPLEPDLQLKRWRDGSYYFGKVGVKASSRQHVSIFSRDWLVYFYDPRWGMRGMSSPEATLAIGAFCEACTNAASMVTTNDAGNSLPH